MSNDASPPVITEALLQRPKVRWKNVGGISISVLYLLWAAYRTDWLADLSTMPLNDLGTFLSGVFAPLAFLWLVLGFFQQGDELRYSAKALWLQGQELQNSVEQQRQLVEATRESITFERERMEEEQLRLKRRAQPDLVFTGGGWSAMGDIAQVTLVLLNRGAACTDLRLTFEDVVIHAPLFERAAVSIPLMSR